MAADRDEFIEVDQEVRDELEAVRLELEDLTGRPATPSDAIRECLRRRARALDDEQQ